MAIPWGSDSSDGRVCWRRWKTREGSCPVANFPTGSSPLGLHDMAGNVAEWTASGFSADYSKPRSGKLRVCRGGSWGDVDAEVMTTTSRCRFDPAQRSDQIGFRCARQP